MIMPRKAAKLTPKGQQTRRRIVEAASRLAEIHGIAGITLEDVRAEALVSSSQIYHYFVDRRSLISAVIDDRESGLADGRNPMFGNFDSPAAVRAWGDYLIDQQRKSQCRNGCPIATLSGDLLTDGERLDHLARVFSRCEDGIRDGYRTMRANGDLATDAAPEALATMTLATVIGGLVLTQFNRDTAPLEGAFNALLTCLEPGINTRKMMDAN
jgi:TetR/AcrR family transcriptional regulator, transcriptional repressor for nem operon